MILSNPIAVFGKDLRYKQINCQWSSLHNFSDFLSQVSCFLYDSLHVLLHNTHLAFWIA